MNILSLFWRGCSSCSNSPNWFICNNNISPLFGCQFI